MSAPNPVPAVLQVCIDSRREAQKIMKPETFVPEMYRPVYFNTSIDIVYLDSPTMLRDWITKREGAGYGTWTKRRINTPVRNLIIGGGALPKYMVELFCYWDGLENLVLEKADGDRTHSWGCTPESFANNFSEGWFKLQINLKLPKVHLLSREEIVHVVRRGYI